MQYQLSLLPTTIYLILINMFIMYSLVLFCIGYFNKLYKLDFNKRISMFFEPHFFGFNKSRYIIDVYLAIHLSD